MKLPIERQLGIVSVAAMALLALAAAISYRSTVQMAADAEAVRRAVAIEGILESLLSSVTDAETGMRGYVITGHESFLAPYLASKAEVLQPAAKLRGLVLDPAQRERLRALLQALDGELESIGRLVEVRRRDGFEAARRQVESGGGKAIHDRLRRLIAEMESAEEAILKTREARTHATTRFTLLALMLGAALAMALAGAAWHTIRRELRLRRQSELALQETNALHQAVLDGVNHAIIASGGGRIRLFNRGAEELLGYRAAEVVGKCSPDIFHDPQELAQRAEILSVELGQPIQPGAQVFQELARQGGARESEWTYVRKDGTRFPILLSLRALVDSIGHTAAFVGIAQDFSFRKQAERALRESNDRLTVAKERAEAADRMKSAFLATMSHELRTPLNSILGFTGILARELAGPLNAEQRKQIGFVRNSSQHLLALVNDVLDISKLEAGQLEVYSTPFDLRASVEKAVGAVAPLADRKGLSLRLHIAAEIATLTGDQRRVEQVLLNLLNNAVKFTERGEVAVTVETAPRAVRIRVSDTGIGILPEDLSKLFQPFTQIDTGLSRSHEGTGLGLAICRRLAQLMGGSIDVASQWNHGSAFTLTLPMAKEAAR